MSKCRYAYICHKRTQNVLTNSQQRCEKRVCGPWDFFVKTISKVKSEL